MSREKRQYQEDAVSACLSALSKQVHPLLIAPTGAGKTYMACKIMKEWQEKHNLPCYFFAHRTELIEQAEAAMKDAGVYGAALSVFQKSFNDDYPEKQRSLCVFDEAHHAVAGSWTNILSIFKGPRVAITATPDRLDRQKLETAGFTKVFEISIRELIKDGYLVRPLAQKLTVSVCDNILESYDDALEATAKNVMDEFARYNRKRAMAFLPTVDASRRFSAALRKFGMSSSHLDGTSGKLRDMSVRDFKAGLSDVMCNVALFTEGFDCPEVDCVILLRETKSRALWSQMIGRGLRKHPGKVDCLILDPMWVSGTHTLQPADAFTAHEDAACKQSLGLSDPLQEAEMEDAAAEDRLIKRLKAIERQEEAKEAKERGLIDLSVAVQLFGYTLPSFVEDKPATASQRAYLERFQVYAHQDMTEGQASYLIAKLNDRQRLGLATAKQVRKLKQFGHRMATGYTFEQASRAIGSDWRITRGARFRKAFKS